MIVLSTHIPIKHHNNTPFMENPNQNVIKTNIKNVKFLNFKIKMRPKKSFHVNYIHSILMFISNIKIPHAHC